MNYTVKIMPQAEQELEDIAYYIALDSPKMAHKFVKALVSSLVKTLSVFPEGGIIYKGDIRTLAYKQYTAFYIVKKIERSVHIVHIVNLKKPLPERNISL